MTEQRNTALITNTLNHLASNTDFKDWVALAEAIGKLGTISGIMADDRNTMTTVLNLLNKLVDNPHQREVTIRDLAVILDDIMDKNVQYIPMCVPMIERLVKNQKNNQQSLGELYGALGHSFICMTPEMRRRAWAVLQAAPGHPGATKVSISAADRVVPPLIRHEFGMGVDR